METVCKVIVSYLSTTCCAFYVVKYLLINRITIFKQIKGSASPHLGMNSPNLAPNPGARLGNSPLNNLNAMNNMNSPSMGSPINQNPHVMKNNGQMCPSMNNLNSLNSPIGNGECQENKCKEIILKFEC